MHLFNDKTAGKTLLSKENLGRTVTLKYSRLTQRLGDNSGAVYGDVKQ